MPKSARALAHEIEELWERADKEGRDLTLAERERCQSLIDTAKSQKALEDDIRLMDPGAPLLNRLGDGSWGGGGPGDRCDCSVTLLTSGQ